LISKEQIAELVRLYSEFHSAIDPSEPAVLESERQFYAMLHQLHETHASDLPFHEFRLYAMHECKVFLRKNTNP
jgi:hypothetical protein